MNIKPFGAFLMLLVDTFNSYGWAILAFGLIVKIIMLPFQMKSKKSMMRTTMLQPRMKELEKRYGHNKQKYQEEVAKLYKDAKANPMSGCLWTLIPFPILIALYSVVRQPLTKLMNLTKEQITLLTDTVANMGLYTIPEKADAYAEMTIANIISENFDAITGNGAASKEQVQELLRRILNIPRERLLPELDATDALAAALCHFYETQRPVTASGPRSWKEFVARNPGRVK